MSNEDTLISNLVDGCLTEEQAAQLKDSLRQSPVMFTRLRDELILSDMLAREMNPARADDLFLEKLNTLLDNPNLIATEPDAGCSDAESELPTVHKTTMPPLRHTWKSPISMRLICQMAASFVICAGLFWQFALRPAELSGTIASIEEPGNGFKIQRGETVLPAGKNMPLQNGDLIVSSMPDQRLAFNFTDGSKISLDNGGSIRIQEYRRKGKLLSLDSGSAGFKVNPQKNPFRVTTQHGTVTVLGTAFVVETGASSMDLNVTEGVVALENAVKKKITVRAGEQAVARKGSPDIRHRIARPVTDLWTPAELPTISAWYDAADTSTITKSGGAVSQWRDKSGNGLHLSQWIAKYQPATGSTINSLNAIDFTRNFMATARNPFGAIISNAFVIVVHKVDSVNEGCLFTLTDNYHTATKRWQACAPWSGGELFFDCGELVSPNRVSATYGVTAGSVVLASFYCSTAKNVQQVYKNGALLVGDSSGHAVPTAGNIVVGGGEATQDTTLGEFIIINGTVDAVDRQKLEGYLAHKWGLSANLPADHPYKAHPLRGGCKLGVLGNGLR